MPNPLYDSLMNQGQSYGPTFSNPVNKVAYILQAMQNPSQFVKNACPDVPDNISNNPQAILQYLQQTRGISNSQLQQIINMIPPGMR